MGEVKLKPAAKVMIILILGGIGYALWHFVISGMVNKDSKKDEQAQVAKDGAEGNTGKQGTDPKAIQPVKRPGGVVKVALSEWPGHMPLVIGNGGLKTQGGSAAANEGLSLEIVFIEDPAKKNKALQTGEVDFVWQTVDEMPINLGSYKEAGVEVAAFLQLDWSRGGDACVAAKEIKSVEAILGRTAAMMKFSPDHTVFEFMLNNSRLTPAQVTQVRKAAKFSADDPAFGRELFVQGKADVACLWEPDVTVALKGRKGAHRLFSTADANELVADVLLVKKTYLERNQATADKVAKVWFAGVAQAEADKQQAAKMISSVVPRFKKELGFDGTVKALNWVKWTNLADNGRFFGLGGERPAFDRVYSQADSIWGDYPDAEIKHRFAPQSLRDKRVVQKLWAGQGPDKPTVAAPVYNPKIAKTGKAVFTKPITINFNTGQSQLDTESRHILNKQVLPQLQMARAMYVRVEGNTDNVGRARMNEALSLARAKAVAEFLISKGIDRNRITPKGNGDKNPVASNKTRDGQAANRRTDILFIRGS